MSQLYATQGRFAEAETEFLKFRPLPGSWTPDAQGYNKLLLAAPPEDDIVADLAVSYALMGDRDKAFDALEKAFSIQDDELIFGIRYPALDSLRTDPRYAALMRRLALPE